MKTKKGISRLLEIAGERKIGLVLSGVLSAVSAVFMLVPYAAAYFILAELLRNGVDPARVDRGMMVHWGVMAILGTVVGLIFLYLSSMASHVAAFRILYGLRVRLAEHLGRLHLGYLTRTSTGAVKKTMEQNVERIENFIAHQIPDLVNALVTVLFMFTIMFYLSPWLAAVCVICIGLGVSIQVSMMYGKKPRP